MNLEEAWRHLGGDPELARLLDAPDRPRLNRDESVFQGLVSSIVYQQLSGKAAGAIWQRFLDRFGGEMPAPEVCAASDPDELRALGLSRQKAAYILDLSARVADGRLPLDRIHEMADEEAREHLVQVKGIGIWTADMMLIFTLGRPDILPTLDLGIRRGFQRLMALDRSPTEAEMIDRAEPWRPWRTAASLLLWRLADIPDPKG
ncbi:MAG: DNA-3-methyladenine glycosylase [Fimbriimonadaceae bacterium]|nr:DNA-3-methyladenine glycosylase [Fimbriimonadaceae bacterium]